MKTVHLHSSGDLRRHDEPVPIAGLSEKLVRIKSVGLCGSDLHWFYEGDIEDAMLEPLGVAIHSTDHLG